MSKYIMRNDAWGIEIPIDECCTLCCTWNPLRAPLVDGLCERCAKMPKEKRDKIIMERVKAIADRIDEMALKKLDPRK